MNGSGLGIGLAALALGLGGACGSDDEPPLTDATSLACPAPGDLPFRLPSRGFARAENATIAAARPRDKSEAADLLGNPGGLRATTYLADDAAPAAEAPPYAGAKARTAAGSGLFSTPLGGERVSLWWYDPGGAGWSALGRGETDADGLYAIAGAGEAPGVGQPVYAMLEADGSCAEHFAHLYPTGTRVVVTDIDGTLTASDAELVMQLADAAYVPRQKTAADAMTRAWAAKGYPVIYLTARPHVSRVETRGWLRAQGFPIGPVITAGAAAEPSGYKARWLAHMIGAFGWVPIAAYGNAATDISAYAAAGIAKGRTFIIGELAGADGTVAIPADDYTAHIAGFIQAQPDAR
jgi:hypothetical protein